MQAAGDSVSRKTIEGLFLALLFWLLAAAAIALGLRRWLPPVASEHGAGIDTMIRYLLITVGALFVAGHGVLGYFLWRFRGQPTRYRRPTSRAEQAWSLIPVLIMALVAEGGVLLLGLPVWGKFYASPPPGDAVKLEITGEQFAWNVRYPGQDGIFGRTDPRLISLGNPLGLDRTDLASGDDVVLLGEIGVPVGRAVQVYLRSKDVLHGFFLPHLRVKQDAVPGMTIQFWFVPTQVGTYEIPCAELCGFGHYMMRGIFRVLAREEFENWMREQPTFF